MQPVDPSFNTIRSSIRYVVANGLSIHFWTDVGSDRLLFKIPFQDCFLSSTLETQQWQIQGIGFKEIGFGL